MGILKYEIKKLFLNRTALCIIIVIAIIPALSNCFTELSYIKGVTSIDELYQLEKKYEGEIDGEYFLKNPDKLSLIKNRAQFQIENKEEQFYFDYYNSVNNINIYKENIKFNADSLSNLKSKFESSESKGKEETYEYKNIYKNYKMITSVPEPKFYFAKGWNDFFSQTSKTSNLFIGIIILLLTSSIFSNEYSSGMDSLIFSSKYGRFKIVKAKLIATIIFSISTIIFYNFIQFIAIMIPTTTIGWNTSIRNQIDFMYSPYMLTMIQYLGINMLFQVIGAITLSFMVTFISSLYKSSLATFFTSFCIYILPFILMILGLYKNNVVNSFVDLSIIKLIGTYDVFKVYKSFNIFGSPILYPYIIILANIFVAIIFGILIKHIISKKDAS
ncbi:ABC transporter permease subunit [Clostridium gasigenes]|uniref:ABC-2 family transporter protein n=1 Tax=Clostridium gasigenes TaxID=94869 RepID=A0A1H0NV18_9CLOT|nr:ABC transporter permease subunit [Clostridium gasigenes]MBU3087645.1 hypothetical protein [Clostridium gasigenes]SDO96607.1 hypothetical protein SAMN04488529_101971 [Clostridium gasigenes]